ncbi:hypothetical protein [Streptohalobacillus salinus]|nr:hypothetical protein [Streptohalobacillus salinus]
MTDRIDELAEGMVEKMDPAFIIGLVSLATMHVVKRILGGHLQVDPLPEGKDFYLNETHENSARRVHVSMLSLGVFSVLGFVFAQVDVANVWIYLLVGYVLSYTLGLNIVHIHMYAQYSKQPKQAIMLFIELMIKSIFMIIMLYYFPLNQI